MQAVHSYPVWYIEIYLQAVFIRYKKYYTVSPVFCIFNIYQKKYMNTDPIYPQLCQTGEFWYFI